MGTNEDVINKQKVQNLSETATAEQLETVLQTADDAENIKNIQPISAEKQDNIATTETEIQNEKNSVNMELPNNTNNVENIKEIIPSQIDNTQTEPKIDFTAQTIRLDCIKDIQYTTTLDGTRIENIQAIEKTKEKVEINEKSKIPFSQATIKFEETPEEKEKRHSQDKKDYRLERMLFDRINAMQGKIKESLELIKKFERINAKDEKLPNIVTTLHDKLTQEVIKQFRTVGIEFNMKSYLVQSIVSDLLGQFEEGITEFKDCSENLNFVREVQEDFESRVELVSTSKVKNLIARLRGLFKPERKQEKLEQLERERQEKKLEEANVHLAKYKIKNQELEKYTIKNNIISSLTREMLFGPGSGLNLTVTEFIANKITPEMKKLGLENLIEQLKENLYLEYKDKNNHTGKEEFFNMQVGEIKKNMKSSRIGYIRTKVNVLSHSNANEGVAV